MPLLDHFNPPLNRTHPWGKMTCADLRIHQAPVRTQNQAEVDPR